MTSRSVPRLLRVALFVVALVAAQWQLVQHQAQIETHAAPDACEWCLAHVPLTGGPAATAAPMLAPAAGAGISAALRISPLAGITLPAYQTRAPPVVLSV